MRKIFCEALSQQITLPDEPKRIVSFSPALTETLFMLGLEQRVVGVSAFCVRPPEARRKSVLGSYSTADLTRVRKLQPDLIFTVTGYQRDFALKLSREFSVYAVELPVSLAGMVDMVVKVGLVAGAIEDGRQLAGKLMNLLRSIAKPSRLQSTYVEIDFGEPVTFGAFSYITDALSMVGLRNLYGTAPAEWLRPDLDEVKRLDPEVIIYEAKMFKPYTFQQLLKLIESRGWGETKAVREQHVYLTPGPLDFLAHHGPSFLMDVLPWISCIAENGVQLKNCSNPSWWHSSDAS